MRLDPRRRGDEGNGTNIPLLYRIPNGIISSDMPFREAPPVYQGDGTPGRWRFALVNLTSRLTQRLPCESPALRIALLGHWAA